ncbi:MAG: hypothetical protein Q3980_05295 [Turicibacter sp.]|nr:hypothetical protein [Turicibacter sp.]
MENLSVLSTTTIDSDFIESCFKQLSQYNYKASYYLQLLTSQLKTANLPVKQQTRLLYNKFRKDAISQLERLFKVKNIYTIDYQLAPLVQKFFRQVYIPSPLLIEQILQVRAGDHQKIAFNYDLTYQIDSYHSFESEIKETLSHHFHKEMIPSPRIEFFLDYVSNKQLNFNK